MVGILAGALVGLSSVPDAYILLGPFPHTSLDSSIQAPSLRSNAIN